MTARKAPILPLILVSLVYLVCTFATARWLQKTLGWALESQGAGISLAGWAVTAGPLVVTLAALSGTIVSWRKGRRGVAYALSAGLFAAFLAIITLTRAPAP